jgi:hypothetical protein
MYYKWSFDMCILLVQFFVIIFHIMALFICRFRILGKKYMINNLTYNLFPIFIPVIIFYLVL